MEELKLSWAAVESACRSLAEDIRAQNAGDKFECMIAIARGGLIPATLVYEYLGLNIPIHTLHMSSYHSEDRTQAKITFRTQRPTGGYPGTCLVVDDIVDSGKTMQAISSEHRFRKAALVTKPRGEPFVQAYSILVPQDWWVVFPWETDNDGKDIRRSESRTLQGT
jgi:hypoxanthine phosphoribosyltransferase